MDSPKRVSSKQPPARQPGKVCNLPLLYRCFPVPELDLFPVDDDWWRIRHDVLLATPPKTSRWKGYVGFALMASSGVVASRLLETFVDVDRWFAVIMGFMIAIIVLLPVYILVIGFHGRRRTRAILRERLLHHGVLVCMSCGYCLRGLPADAERCPECGRPIEERVRVLMRDASRGE
jgi:hypothetical protein